MLGNLHAKKKECALTFLFVAPSFLHLLVGFAILRVDYQRTLLADPASPTARARLPALRAVAERYQTAVERYYLPLRRHCHHHTPFQESTFAARKQQAMQPVAGLRCRRTLEEDLRGQALLQRALQV